MKRRMLYREYMAYVRFILRNPYIFGLTAPEKKKKKKKGKDGDSKPEADYSKTPKRPEDFPPPPRMSNEELAKSPIVKDILGQ